LKRTIALIGGGHAHVEVLRQLALTPPIDADFALFNPSPSVWYSGMLPGVIAGHYTANEAKVNLWALCQRARVRFFESSVTAVSATNAVLEASHGERHQFDLASLDIGSVSRPLPTAPGAYVVTVKPIEPMLAAITEFDSVRAAGLVVRVVGGGAAAVEVALALAFRWRGVKNRRVSIVTAERLMHGFPRRVRALALRACRQDGVEVLENSPVEHIEPTRIRLTSGRLIDTQLTVLATGYAPAPLLERTDLTRTNDGSVHVSRTLQSTSHPIVFAAGDCAHPTGASVPKSGVYAVRQGPLLAANILAQLGGGALQEYRHNGNSLMLLSLGEQRAIATRNGLAMCGDWVWRWKDRIDRAWMNKYAPE
jgi:selenide,water dikinase